MINSLKIKIISLILCILTLIFSTVAYITFQYEKDMLNEIAVRNSTILVETINSSIQSAMLSGRSEEVSIIFNKISSRELVRSLRIVSPSGKILNSGERSEIGTMLPQLERKQLENGSNVPKFLPEERAYDSYTKINNSPQCHKCHDRSRDVLGILEIKLSLDYMDGFISRGRRTAILSITFLIILTFINIILFLSFYVDGPLKKLIASMKRVENGDFTLMSPVNSSNEMQTLTKSFNVMVQRLKLLMESTIVHERELVRAQAQLSHHGETESMNNRLELQIREIENLNISLEERIEEIEEANSRICDLAGELEHKNSKLEDVVANLSTLYKVGLAINSSMDLERVFKVVVRSTRDTLHAEIGYIMLYDQAENELHLSTLIGYTDILSAGAKIEMKPSSVSAWVIENRRPLLIADIDDSPDFDKFSVLGYERKSLICAPLLLKEEIIGTITMVNKSDGGSFSNDQLDLLITIAAQAAIAIKNAKLYDDQQKTYLNTIQALVSAIEASDRYTLGHSERVTRYAMALSKKLDLSETRLKVIERAAILHDIGKIGIDLSLLHKEAKLTGEDRMQLQQHPVIGMRILEPIDFLQDVRICIGQHHERYDGRGYPNGIAGCDLLLESRILAIADSFDAMTSDRPYRKALTVGMAIQELWDNAGTQFDPDLVPLFVELWREELSHHLPSALDQSGRACHAELPAAAGVAMGKADTLEAAADLSV